LDATKKNPRAIVSVAVCAALVAVGVVRFLSYSQGTLGDTLRQSIVGFLCYNPASRISAQYLKILATPVVVAGFYFFFRWRNATAPSYFGRPRLDFKSPLLRIILTTIVTLHWLGMEWWKFHVEGFYPGSPLEHRWLNVGVLIVGQAFTFWSMKFLSFAPLSRPSVPPDGSTG
jgi:hypothetical protein